MTGTKGILWLEDNPASIRDAVDLINEKSADDTLSKVELEIVTSVVEAAQELEREPPIFHESGGPSGFIIDVMIKSCRNLNQINIPNSDTRIGLMAGAVFIDRYLRRNDSPYTSVPILMFTNRASTEETEALIKDVSARGGAPITYIEKGVANWGQKLQNWLEGLPEHRMTSESGR